MSSLISSGRSVPFRPTSSALTKTSGLAASTIDTSTFLPPGSSRTSTTLPVGRRPFPSVPAGSTNFNLTGAPVPGTPAIEKSPSYTTPFSSVTTSSTIIFCVFVLKTRTDVISASGFTSPFSIAKAPTPEEIFPQFPL